MSDFLIGLWALLSGWAGGPLGVFVLAFAVTCIILAVVMTLGHGANSKLNGHYPMPKEGDDS